MTAKVLLIPRASVEMSFDVRMRDVYVRRAVTKVQLDAGGSLEGSLYVPPRACRRCKTAFGPLMKSRVVREYDGQALGYDVADDLALELCGKALQR